MPLQPKITDEAALKAAHPDLFKVNERALKKRLIAARTLGQTIPGAVLVEVTETVKSEEPKSDIPDFVRTKKEDA